MCRGRNNARLAARRQAGLTLVETMFSVVIMSVMIVMAMGTFGTLVKSRRTTNSRLLAATLAQQMMAEILQQSYVDPAQPTSFGRETGETGGTRVNFDDVDDYDDWSETPPAASDGTAIAGFTGWTRAVVVDWVDPTTLAVSATETGLKRITVTVTNPQKVKTSVVALRSSSGTYDQKPAATTNAVRWVGVALQIGGDSANRMVSGTNLLNIVPG